MFVQKNLPGGSHIRNNFYWKQESILGLIIRRCTGLLIMQMHWFREFNMTKRPGFLPISDVMFASPVVLSCVGKGP